MEVVTTERTESVQHERRHYYELPQTHLQIVPVTSPDEETFPFPVNPVDVHIDIRQEPPVA